MKMDRDRFRSVAWASALCAAAAAHAAVADQWPDARKASSRMALVVFEDAPGGIPLLRGNYEAGLAESLAAYQRSPARYVLELANNLCVAYMMLGEFAAAEGHCQRGIEPGVYSGSSNAEAKRNRAVILVNRGVLYSVQGEMAAAGADFTEAGRSFPELGIAHSNLRRIGLERGARDVATE